MITPLLASQIVRLEQEANNRLIGQEAKLRYDILVDDYATWQPDTAAPSPFQLVHNLKLAVSKRLASFANNRKPKVETALDNPLVS